MTGRGGNIKSSDRRTQGINLSRGGCVRKHKHTGWGMVKRLGREEENKRRREEKKKRRKEEKTRRREEEKKGRREEGKKRRREEEKKRRREEKKKRKEEECREEEDKPPMHKSTYLGFLSIVDIWHLTGEVFYYCFSPHIFHSAALLLRLTRF